MYIFSPEDILNCAIPYQEQLEQHNEEKNRPCISNIFRKTEMTRTPDWAAMGFHGLKLVPLTQSSLS